MAQGAIIAVAELYGCHLNGLGGEGCGYDGAGEQPANVCNPWGAEGQWHWQLRGVVALAEPVAARGCQNLRAAPPQMTAGP